MGLRIIITAPTPPFLMETLTQKGYEVMYEPTISYESLSQIIDTATGLIVTTRLKIDQSIINAAKQLKWIGRIGSGMELIDTEYAASKNIQCLSTPEGNCTTVGEHALGLLLSLMNRIHGSYDEIKNLFENSETLEDTKESITIDLPNLQTSTRFS